MDALCLWWCCNTATGSFVPPTQRKYDTQWLEQKQVSKGNPEKWKRLWGWIKKRPRKHKRVETQSYAVLKVKWAKDLCFVHPSADLKPPAIEILVRFSLKFSPPPEQAEVISLLQLQLHLFISLISPSPICTCVLNSSRQSHSKLSSTPCTSCHQPV